MVVGVHPDPVAPCLVVAFSCTSGDAVCFFGVVFSYGRAGGEPRKSGRSFTEQLPNYRMHEPGLRPAPKKSGTPAQR